jgi:hypothetical protein
MPIYRKGDDQFSLWNRAKDQEASHKNSEADDNGHIIGLNPHMSVQEYKDMGGGPVSAKGMRMGANTLHWQRKNPQVWKQAGLTTSDERAAEKKQK